VALNRSSTVEWRDGAIREEAAMGKRALVAAALAVVMGAGCTRGTAREVVQRRPVTVPEVGAPGDGGTAAGGAAAAAPNPGVGPRAAAASASGATQTSTPTPAAQPAGAPIRIGSVGTMSGVGGAQIGTVKAVQAWQKNVNRNGGINGHPVEVITADDGGDAARFRANVRKLVDEDHVIAFVGALTVFALSEGAVKDLEERGVPMVGGDRINTLWTTKPMLFPQASAGPAAAAIHMLNLARVAGRGAPIGWVVCQEAQFCKDADAEFVDLAPKLGLDVRYHAQAATTAPDYTAQCRQAQQSGVQWFINGLDPGGVRRLADNCAQQNYRPRFVFAQTSEEMAKQSSLDGSLFASATFPWLSDANPAMHEFQTVIHRYAPGMSLSAHASSGWVAAKLFEKAAARIGPGVQPTSAQILEGLWSVHDDTLGGITAPLSFVRGKPAPLRWCYFPMRIEHAKWIAESASLTCETRP
jgi:branched-chain amino acid transport system substrate-binding protein